MKSKFVVYPLLILSLLGIGYFAGTKISFFKTEEKEQATVMLDKIKKVLKLVVVEGYFSELYDYEQTNLFNAPGLFNKKALIKVRAKASLGYDFDKMQMDIDNIQRTIHIKNFPQAELLSLEHDLDYYDIQESLFNTFSAEDLTKLNKNAKDFITKEVLASPLFDAAKEQKSDLLEMLQLAVIGTGWRLIIDEPEPILN